MFAPNAPGEHKVRPYGKIPFDGKSVLECHAHHIVTEMLAKSDRLLLEELKRRLQEAAGDRLQAVIAYGSRVWGQPGPDSDLDVAVLIQSLTPELEDALDEAAYQVMWEHDFIPIISLKVFEAINFTALQKQGFSFYRKVAQEGVSM